MGTTICPRNRPTTSVDPFLTNQPTKYAKQQRPSRYLDKKEKPESGGFGLSDSKTIPMPNYDTRYTDGVNGIPPYIIKRFNEQPRVHPGRHEDILNLTLWMVGEQKATPQLTDEAICGLVQDRYPEKGEKEIRDAIKGAHERNPQPAAGARRAGFDSRPWQPRYEQPAKPKVKPVAINPSDIPGELPEIEQPTLRQTIEKLFRPGDVVCLGYRGIDEKSGLAVWKPIMRPFEKLMEDTLNPAWFVGSAAIQPKGAYFVPNPFKTDDNRKTENVADFRYVMFEADPPMRKTEQLARYRASNLPIVSLVDSGGDSLHALVRVEAANLSQYKERAELAKAKLGDGFDNTQDPVRFTRLPNVERKEKGSWQRLVSWYIGAPSWEQWEAEQSFYELSGGSILDYANMEIDDSKTLLGENRYLCRGGGTFIVAPSGQGKSALAAQLASEWAIGGNPLGINAHGQLRVLIIQAEDDDGDLKEMSQWILNAGFSKEKLSLINRNTHIETVKGVVGDRFLTVLDDICGQWRPDIVIINPYTSFLGGDVKDEALANHFLREGITPLLDRHNCAAIIMHHTPKTQFNPSTDFTATDFMYRGSGCASMTNWARAYLVFECADDINHVFRFVAAKRGQRLEWEQIVKFFRWSREPGVIKWEPADEAEVESLLKSKPRKKEQLPDEKLLSVFSILDPIAKSTAEKKMMDMNASQKAARSAIQRFIDEGCIVVAEDPTRDRGSHSSKYVLAPRNQ
jgi:RecA-family ATPase